jgi:hypothetical protein
MGGARLDEILEGKSTGFIFMVWFSLQVKGGRGICKDCEK